MDFMNQIGGLLQQYAGGQTNQTPQAVDQDYDQVAKSAPSPLLAEGLSAAFRSDQTPPFGQMAAQLFNNSNGQQRAGLLNMLIGVMGPALVSQFLSRGGLSGLGNLLGSGQTQVTPEQAQQVPPQVVQDMASHAEQQNPAVVDQISQMYAQNPDLVKSLGTTALSTVLARLGQSSQR